MIETCTITIQRQPAVVIDIRGKKFVARMRATGSGRSDLTIEASGISPQEAWELWEEFWQQNPSAEEAQERAFSALEFGPANKDDEVIFRY